MTLVSWRKSLAAFLVGVAACFAAATAHADPPYRVARLAYESGAVSFSPAGEDEWSRAAVNRPLIPGDRLWVDAGSRAELQIDGGALRIGGQSSVRLLNVDNRIAQVELAQGTMEVRVWRLDPDQTVEIDTPNFAAVIRRPGAYRIDADEQNGSTAITVRAGDVTLYGEGHAFRLAPGQTWEFYDTALRDYDTYEPGPADELLRFAQSRDRRWQDSVSARHVSRQLIGFEELDDYGSWRQVPDYGWAWFPTRVESGWAPYRDGHWAWVEPWGWTWVDDAPWGFAPSHYGRWASVDNRWCWIPGPASSRPVYAPALVAFIGGSGLSVSIGVGGGGGGMVGWFPLGPRDVYRPAYTVSRDYFTRVNVSNTVINVTQVNNYYNVRDARDITYHNQRVPGAVVAVPTATFTQARPVAKDIVRVTAANVQPQAVMAAPPVAPAKQSVLGAQPAQRKPPERAFGRQVVAQTAPPPPPPPIESKLQQLREHPGRPLAPAPVQPRQQPAPGGAPAPAVKVVPQTQPAAAPPPPRPEAPRQAERQQRREERQRERAAEGRPGATPTAPTAPTAPSAQQPAAQPPTAREQQRPEDAQRAQREQQQQQQQQQRAAEQQQREQQRAAEQQQRDQQRAAQQQQQQQRAAEQQQRDQQRAAQQQQQQQRAAEQHQRAAEQQQREQQRAAEQQQRDQQRAAQQQQQQQRAAEQQQRAAEQQQREQQRAAEQQQRDQQRAAQQQQQQQRAAEQQQRAAEQQQREQQRAAEQQQRDQQRAAQQQQQQQRAAEQQQRAAEQQQRAAEQQRAAQQQQQQQQRAAEQQQRAAEQQQQRASDQQPRGAEQQQRAEQRRQAASEARDERERGRRQ